MKYAASGHLSVFENNGSVFEKSKGQSSVFENNGSVFQSPKLLKTDKMSIILAHFTYKKASSEFGGHSVYESTTEA